MQLSWDSGDPAPWQTRAPLGAVRDVCNELGLFRQIAEKAGPDLTNETWWQAADTIGEVQLTEPYASIRAGKYDATDAFRLAGSDSTGGPKGDLAPVSPIEDASK